MIIHRFIKMCMNVYSSIILFSFIAKLILIFIKLHRIKAVNCVIMSNVKSAAQRKLDPETSTKKKTRPLQRELLSKQTEKQIKTKKLT